MNKWGGNFDIIRYMALIDIPTRVEAYIATHQGLTPPCFAVALDAVTGGNGVAYEEFNTHYPPSGGVNLITQEVLLTKCFPGNVWLYSPAVVDLVSPSKAPETNNRVTEGAARKILDNVATAALVISEPGSVSRTNHARAITPARPGTAIIWDSKSDPLIKIVEEPELKQVLVECLGRPESHLFAIGFNIFLQDLLWE